MAARIFSAQELEEVFPHPPLREVAFEVRFPPKLRVGAEIWRLQDQLVDLYPEVRTESAMQPDGSLLNFTVFQNRASARIVKVSLQNLIVAFTQYTRFEDFIKEITTRTDQFCATFAIESFVRVGLRYVNEIALPGAGVSDLRTFVRPIINFDGFPAESVNQFAAEVHSRFNGHLVTLRSALLSGNSRTYVLDIDCHSSKEILLSSYSDLLSRFHDSAQQFFLDHLTEEYKQVMRGKK